MSVIAEIQNPWRQILLSAPASFRGIIFNVESGGLSGGRRAVVHEYPKRNKPYAEDMGRQAARWTFTGYLVYRPTNPLYEYTSQRIALISALAADDVGILVHPVFSPGGISVMCLGYSSTESRERGGFTQFDMQFVEAGAPGNNQPGTDTVGNVNTRAGTAEQTAGLAFSSLVIPSIPFVSAGVQVFKEAFGSWPNELK